MAKYQFSMSAGSRVGVGAGDRPELGRLVPFLGEDRAPRAMLYAKWVATSDLVRSLRGRRVPSGTVMPVVTCMMP